MNDEQTSALREAVENMRNMRESYDELSRRNIYADITNEEQAVADIDAICSEIYVLPNNEQEE